VSGLVSITPLELHGGMGIGSGLPLPAAARKCLESAVDTDVPIRALSRGIAVLQAINRAGSISMMEIARTSAVPYPTACRIVQTLLHEGLIERETSRKRYRPTALVQTLSHGFHGHARLVKAARPHIVALTNQFSWPVALATHVGASMVIQDSTHSLTSLTFNDYHPGYALPMLECAAGLAYLAHLPVATRAQLFATHRLLPDRTSTYVIDLFEKSGLAEEIRGQGYATRARNPHTRNPGKTSSIAVPLMVDGEVAASLTLSFFATAIKMNDAVARYHEPLLETARAISRDLDASPPEAIG